LEFKADGGANTHDCNDAVVSALAPVAETD
jgi:hypothetical protein